MHNKKILDMIIWNSALAMVTLRALWAIQSSLKKLQ